MSSDQQQALKAKIADREVTVQVLRVDAKKMTLQLFRQIPKADWLDEHLAVRTDMVIWGRVDYKIPGEGVYWLLIQVGDELRKCSFHRPSDSTPLLALRETYEMDALEQVEKLAAELIELEREPLQTSDEVLRQMRERRLATARGALERARASSLKASNDAEEERRHNGLQRQRQARYDEIQSQVTQLFLA